MRAICKNCGKIIETLLIGDSKQFEFMNLITSHYLECQNKQSIKDIEKALSIVSSTLTLAGYKGMSREVREMAVFLMGAMSTINGVIQSVIGETLKDGELYNLDGNEKGSDSNVDNDTSDIKIESGKGEN